MRQPARLFSSAMTGAEQRRAGPPPRAAPPPLPAGGCLRSSASRGAAHSMHDRGPVVWGGQQTRSALRRGVLQMPRGFLRASRLLLCGRAQPLFEAWQQRLPLIVQQLCAAAALDMHLALV